jgi:hypothetical protein
LTNLDLFLSSFAKQTLSADIILVLVEDSGTRSFAWAKLFAKGFAPFIMSTELEDGNIDVLLHYLY